MALVSLTAQCRTMHSFERDTTSSKSLFCLPGQDTKASAWLYAYTDVESSTQTLFVLVNPIADPKNSCECRCMFITNASLSTF